MKTHNKKEKEEDPMMERLMRVHEAFIGLKIGEMEIRARLEAWLDREDDYLLCSDIIDFCQESDDRAEKASAGLERAAELTKKGATWLKLFKKSH